MDAEPSRGSEGTVCGQRDKIMTLVGVEGREREVE